MSEIEYNFCELPLIIEGGFEAGLIDGIATIDFHPDGEWSVREVALDGFRRRTDAERLAWMADATPQSPKVPLSVYERKPVALCRDSHPWLYDTIIDRLETTFKDSIEDAIEKALEDEREEVA